MKNALIQNITENLNYKLVSLFIAVILWVTILGRRDFVYSKVMNLDPKVTQGLSIRRSSEQVRVRVSGTRAALKKFIDEYQSEVLPLDLTDRGPGVYDFELTPELVKVPLGIKVLSVRPTLVRFEIDSASPSPQQEGTHEGH